MRLTKGADLAAVQDAVSLLKAGKLVAFPTETVYGLGADAQNWAAVSSLYKLKGRPTDHPVIVHLPGLDGIESWSLNVPSEAIVLGRAFWPGPLTMVLKRSDKAKDFVTGGQDTVALRVPNHPIALQLLREFGDGLVAPSANKFGRVSPTLAEHVISEFGEEIPLVLDGGACQVGVESTIVDLSGQGIRILRPGLISAEQIAHALELSELPRLTKTEQTVRVPGNLPRHYAPATPLKLVSFDCLIALLEDEKSSGKRVLYGVISFKEPAKIECVRQWLTASSSPDSYAQSLYANLRTLDAAGCEMLLVEMVPETANWDLVRDRLQRAAIDA
jgi:L-threonylcarbamoyladenylate synthase